MTAKNNDLNRFFNSLTVPKKSALSYEQVLGLLSAEHSAVIRKHVAKVRVQAYDEAKGFDQAEHDRKIIAECKQEQKKPKLRIV